MLFGKIDGIKLLILIPENTNIDAVLRLDLVYDNVWQQQGTQYRGNLTFVPSLYPIF